MLQQTAAENKTRKSGLLSSLSTGHVETKEKKKIIGYLTEDYIAAFNIAANLSSHGKWIPYPFLADRLKKISDELRVQGELFRAKLTLLGGTVPQLATENREDGDFRQNVRRLVKDMEDHASRSETLIHQRNNIRDESVVALIDTIVSEMQKQKDELLDIVMRLS